MRNAAGKGDDLENDSHHLTVSGVQKDTKANLEITIDEQLNYRVGRCQLNLPLLYILSLGPASLTDP